MPNESGVPNDVDDAFAERDQITEQMQHAQQFLSQAHGRIAFLSGYLAAQGEDPTRPWEPPAAPPKPKSAKTRND
jgi:hypothetical protein